MSDRKQMITALPDTTLIHGYLPGAVGQLEAVITPASPIVSAEKKPIAIICHPHPLYDGTMENKVVTTTARVCRDVGMMTIRFNFRGVGLSDGSYGEAIGECDDLRAVLTWLNEQVGYNASVVLAGFSFGSYIAAKVVHQINTCRQLISIAPPVHHFDFEALPMPSCPWQVIQGEADEVVPPDAVYAFCQARPAIQLTRLADTSHFFHRQLLPLKQVLKKLLQG